VVPYSIPLKFNKLKDKMKLLNKYSRKHAFDKDGNLLPIEQRTFITKEGYECVVIDGGNKPGYNLCKIENYVYQQEFGKLKTGSVKYPFHRTVYDVGYFGGSVQDTESGSEYLKIYDLWRGMLRRCYSKTKKDLSRFTAYKDVTVCDEWHNFQTFKKWVREQESYNVFWVLDKDIISGRETKVYSPDTCIFIPQELNSFMTNYQNTNKTGYVGVSFKKSHDKFVAQIKKDGKVIHLGLFLKAEEAAKAYIKARKDYAELWKKRMRVFLPTNILNKIE